MSFVTRQAAHCDQCSHEWLVAGASTPTHCAKCKSRRWNNLGNMQTACVSPVYEPPTFVDTMRPPPKPAASIKPDMQALRDICAGKLPGDMPKGATGYKLSLGDEPIVEVEFCGKTWWEDGEQYECLMDKGHKELKHGMRGMVRKLDA